MFGLIFGSASQPVVAGSDDYGGGWAVPSLDTSISISNENVRRSIFDRQILKSRNSPSNAAHSVSSSPLQAIPNTSSAQKRLSLSYKPSIQRRKQNYLNFVAKTRGDDPNGAVQLAQFFASSDVIQSISTALVPYGLRIDNVADAFAVYWTSAWLGSRGQQQQGTKAQAQAIRTQAFNALSLVPGFENATDAEKQEFAEALLIQAMMIDSAVEQSKANPAQMSKVKATVTQGAKGMGLDLYTMTLTPNGFVPARKGSAVKEAISPLAGDQEERILASNNSVDTATPNYILLAAAGGAGFGGILLMGRVVRRKS